MAGVISTSDQSGLRVHDLVRQGGRDCRCPVSKCLKHRSKVKRTANAVKHVILRPACPPVGFVLVIVLDPFEYLAITVCPGEIDLQGPTRIVNRADRRTETVFPFPVTLRFVPARKPVYNIHLTTLSEQHLTGKK